MRGRTRWGRLNPKFRPPYWTYLRTPPNKPWHRTPDQTYNPKCQTTVSNEVMDPKPKLWNPQTYNHGAPNTWVKTPGRSKTTAKWQPIRSICPTLVYGNPRKKNYINIPVWGSLSCDPMNFSTPNVLKNRLFVHILFERFNGISGIVEPLVYWTNKKFL